MTSIEVAKPARLSSRFVRCVCIVSSFGVMAGGLLGLGLACVVITKADAAAAPCPHHLMLGAFGAAGALLIIAVVFLLWLCTGNKKKQFEGPPHNNAAIEDNAQGNAAVSHWIERQQEEPAETCPLNTLKDDTRKETNPEDGEDEMTPL